MLLVRTAEERDAGAIAAIYNHYIRESVITFEEQEISGDEMARRMREIQAASFPWLVAAEDGTVVGYAYASAWKPRSAYRFSAETTVYVAPGRERRGIGRMLYAPLFELLEQRGTHAVMAGIALPNEASVALHESFGMREVARFREVGFKFGRWIDVAYWQRILGRPTS